MIISSHNLIGLHVETKSGCELGKVASFDIDVDTHGITKYHVKGNSFLENIIHNQELIINQSQVIEITKEKMTVEDGLEKEVERAKQKRIPTEEPVGVMSSSSPR